MRTTSALILRAGQDFAAAAAFTDVDGARPRIWTRRAGTSNPAQLLSVRT